MLLLRKVVNLPVPEEAESDPLSESSSFQKKPARQRPHLSNPNPIPNPNPHPNPDPNPYQAAVALVEDDRVFDTQRRH